MTFADLQVQLNHDIKHRDALTGVGDTEIGVCPTCKRPLEGTLGDLLAEFDEAIASRQREIERISGEMERLVAIGKQHKAAADRAQQLRAQLSSLIDVGDCDHLGTAADEAASTARAAAKREHEIAASTRRWQRRCRGCAPRPRTPPWRRLSGPRRSSASNAPSTRPPATPSSAARSAPTAV